MITVDYSGPKYGPEYAKGRHQFTSFEEFARWYAHIKRPGISVGAVLCKLAEHGSLRTGKVDAESAFFAGYPMKELAREVGVLKRSVGGDSPSKDLGVALEYAKRLDVLSKGVEVLP